MALALVEDTDIATVARQHGPLPPPVAVAVLLEVLRSLAQLHRTGAAHGGIAANTVLLTATGAVHVVAPVDPGVVGSVVSATSSIYRAPEHQPGAAPSAAGDVYAAGVLFLEMLLGCPSRADDVVRAPLPSLFELDPTVPGVIEHAFESLTARAPARRYASAADALADLGAIDAHLTREHPNLLRHFVDEPSRSMLHIRQAMAALEVARADALLSRSTSNVPAAAFALYRAQRLEPTAAIEVRLQRLCEDAGLAFELPDDDVITALKAQIAKDPYSTTAMRQLASHHRSRGDVYQAAVWWRRALRLTPADGLLLRQLELLLVGVADNTHHPREWFGVRLDLSSLDKQATLALIEPRAIHLGDKPQSGFVAEAPAMLPPTVWQRVRELFRS